MKTSAVKAAVKESVSSVVNSSHLAGKINSTFQAFALLSREDIQNIFANVYEAIHAIDSICLCSIGWLFVPAMGFVYSVLNKAAEKGKKEIKRVTSRAGEPKSMDSDSDREEEEESDDSYENSYMYHFAVIVSQIAKLALLVYLGDIFVVAMHTIGYSAEQWRAMANVFAKILFMIWFARRVQTAKTYFLKKLILKAPDNCDKVRMVNSVLDLTVLVKSFGRTDKNYYSWQLIGV